MSDPTVNTKVYMDEGGDRMVVASGGELRLESGAVVTSDGTQPGLIGPLTDSTGGTAGDTVSDVGAAFNQGTLNNNFASLIAKINELEAVIRALGLTASA